MKTIWIVNYYTSPSATASNPRYVELAKHFMKAGYNVITFNALYDASLMPDEKGTFIEKHYGEEHFVHVRSPYYVGNGAKRIYSIFMFAWKLFWKAKRFPKPDLVLHNVHTPFDYPVSWAARRVGAKYIAEGWDMWPEDFETFGLIKKGSLPMKIAYWIEKHLYEKADQVIFTCEGIHDYLREKGWLTEVGGRIPAEKVHYINNGINLQEFDENVKKHPRSDKDLNNDSIYKIIYLGSIRLVNNVKQLIDAAQLLKDNPKYRFLIYGDGNDRPMLEQYVKDNDIHNVIFKEKRIPLCEVAYVVSNATINIMNYQKNFGMHGVSSGKLFQYMAAGKPICCNIKLNYSEITRDNLGIDEELDTPEQYADAIRKLAEQPQTEYEAMCMRVRKCAEKFDYNVLAAKELEVIESLI